MSAERWQRLADRITAAGLPAAVSASGVDTRFISVRLPGGSLVEVHDLWWRKNDKVWLGYNVHVEDRDSIVTKTWPTTKKPADVVAAVLEVTA